MSDGAASGATLPQPPVPVGPDLLRTDVAVVGAGVAGLYTALCLPEHLDVMVVDKGEPAGDSGSSPWAQGGMAVAIGPDDSPRLHAQDTMRASDGLCDPVAVEVLAGEAPAHVDRLLALGAELDRLPGHDGSMQREHLALAREGGQRVARSIRRADATGAEIVRVLRRAVAPRVSRLAAIVLALARDDRGRVVGLWVAQDGRLVAVEARAVVLATGGCGGLYAATTNPDGATGDGLALAARAGAAVRDVEFVQFHPTGLAVGGSWRFLLTEALRGAGATLHDADGRRFLADRHPDAELAPRHVVAKAILDLPEATAHLDATHLGEQTLAVEFPTVLAGARRHGFDLARERVPVTPAAHYQIGGVRTDLYGRTALPGLYAAGEVASTGVHGANRMAGNSLTEGMVFGARTAAAVAGELPEGHTGLGDPPRSPASDDLDPAAVRTELRARMLTAAGPVRDAQGMSALAGWLAGVRGRVSGSALERDTVELHHALTAASLIVASARCRRESRGGHWRTDHPRSDPLWRDVHLEHIGLSGEG